MSEYFSDREFGLKPRIKHEIDAIAWKGLLSLIQERIDNGALGEKFPENCPDGQITVGTNTTLFWDRVKAEIPDLDYSPYPSWGSIHPSTISILDFLEFVGRYVCKPYRHENRYHSFYKHYHIVFNREVGLEEFVADVNLIFSRNQLAFEMTPTGKIQRSLSAPVAAMISSSHFNTGDQVLDNLLNRAVDHFLSPKPEALQDALEKLWDAFERLKTIKNNGDKKQAAEALLKEICQDYAPKFSEYVNSEFRILREYGNNLRIRHSETYAEDVKSDKEREYLFLRMYSHIRLVISKINLMKDKKTTHLFGKIS